MFEPNDEPLRLKAKGRAGVFMQLQFRHGAPAGSTPEEAYFIGWERETKTQDDMNNGNVICEVGFAPLRPAEFMIFKICQQKVSTPHQFSSPGWW